MDKKLILWTIVLVAGISYWFYLRTELVIDYKLHPQLVDPVTGEKRKPNEMLDLGKVISGTKEYIHSTNAQQRLYDLEYNLNLENPFLIDQFYTNNQDLLLSGWPVSDQTLCGQQLNWIQSQLSLHKNYTLLKGQLGYELTNLMDSFGHQESGLYSGAVHWLGSYKHCIKLNLDNGKIKTRYCIGRLRPKSWSKNETSHPATVIRIGLCLPETCDTLSFARYNSSIEALAKLELPDSYKSSLDLESMFCLPDERSPIRQMPLSGYIYLYVVGIWLTIVLIASIMYEFSFNKKARDTPFTGSRQHTVSLNAQFDVKEATGVNEAVLLNILEALSLRCSLKAFKTNTFRVKYNQGERTRVNLGIMDFFKVVMAIFVVLGHSGYLHSVYTRSLSSRIDFCISEAGRLGLSVSRCVDTFFLFFGVLTTYTLMRKFTTKQLSNPLLWLGVNSGVFLRITPIFMLVYWYSRSVSPYTSAGPWWDYGVDQHSMKGVCMSDPWWKSIPYFGLLGSPPVPSCVLPGWFIICYSQISLLLPLITYIISKLPSYFLRYSFIGFLLLASTLNIGIRVYQQTSVKEEGFSLYGGFLVDLMEKFESTGHITTLGRLGSVSVGCLVGYLLRMYEIGEITQWPIWLRSNTVQILTAIIHIFIVLLPIIGHRISLVTKRLVTLEEFVGFNIAMMITWPILNSIIILNGATVNNHRVIMRFFSHSFWHVFNRLGLCIFLVHWEILFVGTTNNEQAPTYGFLTDVWKMWAFGTFFAILLAFVIHIFIEAPLSRLILLLAKPFMKAKASQSKDEHYSVEKKAYQQVDYK